MMNGFVRGIYVSGIGEAALLFESARLDELKARADRHRAIRNMDGDTYVRGDDEDVDLIFDCHEAAAKKKANARRRLSTAVRLYREAAERAKA